MAPATQPLGRLRVAAGRAAADDGDVHFAVPIPVIIPRAAIVIDGALDAAGEEEMLVAFRSGDTAGAEQRGDLDDDQQDFLNVLLPIGSGMGVSQRAGGLSSCGSRTASRRPFLNQRRSAYRSPEQSDWSRLTPYF